MNELVIRVVRVFYISAATRSGDRLVTPRTRTSTLGISCIAQEMRRRSRILHCLHSWYAADNDRVTFHNPHAIHHPQTSPPVCIHLFVACRRSRPTSKHRCRMRAVKSRCDRNNFYFSGPKQLAGLRALRLSACRPKVLQVHLGLTCHRITRGR